MMRINNILLSSIAIVSLLVSCSSEDLDSGPSVAEKVSTIKDSDTEVTLSFGSSRGTRASLNSNTDGTFEATGLGIFMLAKSYTTGNSDLPVNWSSSSHSVKYDGVSYTDTWSVWIRNNKANAIYMYGDDGISITGTEIDWENHEMHYYPYGYYHLYSFYGYYPYSTSTTSTSTQIKVNFNAFDGTQDIIWGKAESDEDYAYSARYYRMAEHLDEDGNQIRPVIAFQHMLSRLDFSIVAGGVPSDSDEPDYTKATQTTVKAIEIVRVPSSLSLILADRGTPANEGTLSVTRTASASIALKETNSNGEDQDLTPVLPTVTNGTPDVISIGQGIMLPPLASTDDPYDIQITLEYQGNEYQLVVPMRLTQIGDMKAGEAYQIKLTIYAPEQIGLTATLTPWKIVDGSTLVGDDGTVTIQ